MPSRTITYPEIKCHQNRNATKIVITTKLIIIAMILITFKKLVGVCMLKSLEKIIAQIQIKLNI